ncbi:GTP-binding protein YPT6 [Tritrichomonas foetus]|uniref:GTP-binding protein YPT6 n=1 Tax=Tritrichomonas foetus TaxID=1144522 RepID=A0A1J4KAV5_9EUKA|nr:GTP-binding protein YPT6 [Tritrichomonas foetus]|eukprot:OHT06836.1 GTP-binding protein YPT6 [Tritrichomonas foetus]
MESSINPKDNDIPEFKIVFVGNESVGKTCIINRFYNNIFSDQQQPTVGAAFVSKEITTKYGRAYLHLWDTAGQERYRCLVPMYARGATVVVIVFDLKQKETFEEIPEWIEKVKDIADGSHIVIVGNKVDLLDDQILPPNQENQSNSNLNNGRNSDLIFKDEIDKWSADAQLSVTYTSAKTGENIDVLFEYIIGLLPRSAFHSPTSVNLDSGEQNRKKCC